jgi:amino acid efflux transporter
LLGDSIRPKAALKLPQIIALYTGSVLGSGILIIPGTAAEVSGPASLLAWGAMTVAVLPMALTMGVLSAKYPNQGGVAYFVTKAFGPHIGSLIGWYFLMAVIVGAPVLALTGARYLCAAAGLGDTWRLMIAIAILCVGLLANYFGMKITGQLQMVVVLTTLTVLVVTITGSLSKMDPANFEPFMPNGWSSVGVSATILFWCFIGWEAVSNMSEEFQNPKQDAIKGTVIASVIISVIYFMTALVIVGTHSYGHEMSDASLIYIIKKTFGAQGAVMAGFATLFICMAPAIAYIGAVSRLAHSLAENGYAPKSLSFVSGKYGTPAGGLCFLALCFAILLVIFSSRFVSMATLIQIPSATFIATYLVGSAAGIRLLKDSRSGVFLSLSSLVLSALIFSFVRWTVLYPALITTAWFWYVWASRKTKTVSRCDQYRP